MTFKKIQQTIKSNQRFLISTHVNPDPDALCSELSLAMFLRSIGKTVYIVNESILPSRFSFLFGSKSIKSFQDGMDVNVDVVMVVDCGDLERIGKVQKLIKGSEKIINIDHHITNDSFGDINLVVPKASSTAEVLFELLTFMKFKINKEVAKHLYLGIMTDTGSFRYENTSSKTFKIVSQLIEHNFSANELYQQVYEMIPYKDLKGVASVVAESESLYDGQLIVIELTKKKIKSFSEEFDLRDMIFRFLRSVKKAEVVAILTEVGSNKTRVNLRSNQRFDVALLASVYSGGGHKRASGCMIERSLKEAKKVLVKQIGKSI